MTHTPAPWLYARVNDTTEAIVTDEGDSVCDVCGASPADLSLIANAPALLAALEACVCAMQDYQAGIGITEMFDKGERMGRAAIARATHTPEN